MKSIAIIVLNWQNWRDTLVCLDSLRSLIFFKPISLIVCDNASDNDSLTQILNWAQQHYTSSEITVFTKNAVSPFTFYKFVLIQTGANLGFAGGNNVGIRYVLASQQYEYLWLLNNDTTVDTYALSKLYDYAITHHEVALLGSTVIDYYQRDKVQCAGGCRYFPCFTIFKPLLGGQSVNDVINYHKFLTLDYVYGASMFLKVEAVQKIGLLNEEYFLFYEELDYTQRLKQQGYEIGWCQKSLVYHKGSASVGNIQEGDKDKLRQANYYENLSTLKYTANFYPYLLPLVMIVRFIGKLLVLTYRRDFYLLIPLYKAYQKFLTMKFYNIVCKLFSKNSSKNYKSN